MGRIEKRKPNHPTNKEEIMVDRKPLNAVEKLILSTIFKKDIPLTPNAIAEATGLAYVTVRKYVDKMFSEGLIVLAEKKKIKKTEKGKRSPSIRYMINPDMWC